MDYGGLSVSSPRCRTNSSSLGELSTTDDGFEKSYLCVTFRKLRPLSVSFVRRSYAIFREFFARADATVRYY